MKLLQNDCDPWIWLTLLFLHHLLPALWYVIQKKVNDQFSIHFSIIFLTDGERIDFCIIKTKHIDRDTLIFRTYKYPSILQGIQSLWNSIGLSFLSSLKSS